MNKNDACLFLNISANSELDDVIEAYDLKIFDLKKKFLQTFLVPALCKSIITKIEKLNEALFAFIDEENGLIEEDYMFVPIKENLSQVILKSISQLNKLRLKLLNAEKTDLVLFAKQYRDLSEWYVERIAKFNDFKVDDTIKMTEYPNEMYLVNAAKKYEDQSISDEDLDILTKEVNRCKNIVQKETLKR